MNHQCLDIKCHMIYKHNLLVFLVCEKIKKFLTLSVYNTIIDLQLRRQAVQLLQQERVNMIYTYEIWNIFEEFNRS
jgi:hypothetical protein